MAISPPSLVLAFLAFFASLFFPLFVVPQLLLRRGVSPWKARLAGWVTFGVSLVVATLAVTGIPTLESLTNWAIWGGAVAITIAAWWDIRVAKRRSQQSTNSTRPKG